MDQPHDQQIAPGTPPEPRETGITPPRSLFDDGPLAPEPTPTNKPLPTVTKRRRSMVTLIVLPAAIFIIGVAVIAWVAQYLPKSRQVSDTPPPRGTAATVIKFTPEVSLWHKPPGWPDQNLPYIREFEVKTGGHFDFEFQN